MAIIPKMTEVRLKKISMNWAGVNEVKLNTDKYEADFDRTEWGRPGLAALVMKKACDFKLSKSRVWQGGRKSEYSLKLN